MNKKKYATIQIDVDGLWVIFQHFGLTLHKEEDILYNSALPRFLELFKAYNIKATFFVVGRDLYVPARVAFLQQAIEDGHEIANHTMTHTEGFSYKTKDEKIEEIATAEKLIESVLGKRPRGFRTPSNDVDEETLRILEDRGYLYDSSLMPTFYGPLLKRIKFAKLKIKRKDNYLGKWHYGLSPLTPYHPSPTGIHKKGSMNIIEVPITTIPFLRFPFHTSFVMATQSFGCGTFLFDFGFFLLKLCNIPYNFVFHTNELSDPIFHADLSRQFGLHLSLKTKQTLCEHVLSKVTQHYTCITTHELIESYTRTTKL
jgi:hypothetical protein